jgi:hypothetical protein
MKDGIFYMPQLTEIIFEDGTFLEQIKIMLLQLEFLIIKYLAIITSIKPMERVLHLPLCLMVQCMLEKVLLLVGT